MKLKNINKKILSGTLAMTLVMVPMSGCTDFNTFDYTVNEDGQYEVSGNIDYELLKDYEFVVIENKEYATTEYYLCKKFHTVGRGPYSEWYLNVFNDQQVFSTKAQEERNLVYSEDLENYLYATNNIKKNYTVEDVELIFEEMKENYINSNNKKLVK